VVPREKAPVGCGSGPWRYNGFKKGGNQLGLSLINFAWHFRRRVEVSQAQGTREG